MNKACINLLIVLAVMSSCNSNSKDSSKTTPDITKGEGCSVKVSGIEFTKSLNDAMKSATVDGDKLIITSNAQCDNFNDPDAKLSNNTAPVLLTKIDNAKPFTFIAKVAPTFKETYDAGTMYIYLNPDLWFKFALRGMSA